MTPRRRLSLIWLVALLGLLTIVTAQLLPNRHRMEDDLTRRSTQALTQAGGPPVEVAFTGRDGVLRAADESTAGRAREIVARVEGVRTVRTVVPPPAAPVHLLPPSLLVSVADGRIALTGIVPGRARRDMLHEAAAGGFTTIDDRVTVGSVTDDSLAALPGFLSALPRTAKDLNVHLDQGVLTLTGTVSAEAEWVTVTEAARRTGITVVDELSVAALGPQLDAVPPLLFPSDSAWLSPQAQRNLWRAAGLLHANPSATITVEGHTDALDAPGWNDQLSRDRATAVRDVLASFGIDQDRMTISGYADSRPTQANDTDGNRAQNRRAELVVTAQPGPPGAGGP